MKNINRVFILLHLISWITSEPGFPYVDEVFNWKHVEYEYLPELEKLGPYPYYIPENNNIVDVGHHARSDLFIVAVLRVRPGIPITLGAFCGKDYGLGSSPKICGFPNYETNMLLASDFEKGPIEDDEEARKGHKHRKPEQSQGNHPSLVENPSYHEQKVSRIISVSYITIDDKCDRVFFMDNGLIHYYRNATYVIQKPTLYSVGLPSNGCELRNFPIIRTSELPARLTTYGSNGFMNLVVDYNSKGAKVKCDDIFLYIPNAFYNNLLVYNYKKDEFWVFEHESFQPILAESYFVFDKTFKYQIDFGLKALAIGGKDEHGDRIVYYAPMASTGQYAVSTKVLSDPKKYPRNYDVNDFQIIGYKGSGHQVVAMAVDYKYDVVYFGEVDSNQIRCWNFNKPLNPDNIGVIFESDKLLVGYGVMLDSAGYLWCTTNRVPKNFLTDFPLDVKNYNTRVFRIKVSDAIQGTVCE